MDELDLYLVRRIGAFLARTIEAESLEGRGKIFRIHAAAADALTTPAQGPA